MKKRVPSRPQPSEYGISSDTSATFFQIPRAEQIETAWVQSKFWNSLSRRHGGSRERDGRSEGGSEFSKGIPGEVMPYWGT